MYNHFLKYIELIKNFLLKIILRLAKSQYGKYNVDIRYNYRLTPQLAGIYMLLNDGYNFERKKFLMTLSNKHQRMINFLTGNEISKVEGMEGLHDLRELVLDRNKIKIITELSFANQWNLQELHLEENRIRELTYLNCMDNLQRLYLGSNRVQVMFLL